MGEVGGEEVLWVFGVVILEFGGTVVIWVTGRHRQCVELYGEQHETYCSTDIVFNE